MTEAAAESMSTFTSTGTVELSLSIEPLPDTGVGLAAEAGAIKQKAAMTDTEQAKLALWKFFICS